MSVKTIQSAATEKFKADKRTSSRECKMLPAQSEDGKMEEHAEASVETKWLDTVINFHSAAK